MCLVQGGRVWVTIFLDEFSVCVRAGEFSVLETMLGTLCFALWGEKNICIYTYESCVDLIDV